MPQRVVHLTSVHPAFDVRIFEKECRSLAAAGYDVAIIAPHEKDETREGVRLVSVPLSRNRRERITKTVLQVYRAALQQNADIYHFHDPELLPVGILLKLRGKLVIYDVHENYGATLRGKAWIPGALRAVASMVVRVVENAGAAFFDAVVTATPSIAELFPKKKTVVVRNFPRLASVSPAYQLKRLGGQAVYVGNVTTVRGSRTMVEAIALVPKELSAELAIAGSLSDELRNELQNLPGWAQTRILGWLSRAQVEMLLAESRLGLCVLHPTPNHVEAYPIKLFEYMGAGIPVVASDFPLWREFVIETNCGLVVDPLSPIAIAEAITWLLSHPEDAEAMGRNGQMAVQRMYSWEREADQLVETYKRLLPAIADGCV